MLFRSDELIPLTEVPQRFTRALHIRLSTATARADTLTRIEELLRAHRGTCPVFLCFMYPAGPMVFLEAHENFAVMPGEELVGKLEALLGEDTVWLKVDNEKLNASGATAKRRFTAAA